MGFGVALYRRAAQALEYADLDLVRLQSVQTVESAAKTRKVLTGQPRDQIDVYQCV